MKSKIDCLGCFKLFGGPGACGNDRKRPQLRACKIWCKSVPGASVLQPFYMLEFVFCLFLNSILQKTHQKEVRISIFAWT